MDGKIKYRDYKAADFPYMEKMFCKAFGLGMYSDNEDTMNHLLSNYLYSYLERESFIVIAEYESEPVGFLIGNYRDDIKMCTRIKYKLLERYHQLFIEHLTDGKEYFRCKALIDEADSELIKHRRNFFDSELILFVVDEKMRGHGIGRELLERFKKYLMDCGGKQLYLYTDDFSNVDFYRRMKFKQEDSRIINLGQGEENSRFYLFSIPVKMIA